VSPKLAWSRVDGDHCLRLTGWSARERAVLTGLDERGLAERIVVLPTSLAGAAGADDVDAPVGTTRLTPAAGRFSTDADGVTFVPRFPFLADTSYTVLVHPSLCGSRLGEGAVDVADYRRFTLAARRSPRPATTVVTAIHPSGDAVPRNLLRCYVHFSAPMSEGEAPACVHLADRATGAPITGAFLEMDPELWDRARTRLTVLLDPARIKRGLAPHREAGYALAEGRAVSLVVDRAFRDAEGRPLVDDAVQHYRVAPDVRGRVDPTSWGLEVPAAGSRDALLVAFGRPLDHALLGHRLWVESDGERVPGRMRAGPADTTWAFTPDGPWRPVRHGVVADAMLEDVAGNSVVRVFDRDLTDAAHEPVDASRVTREFTPIR
jgi:hypothetical protein